MVYALTRRHSGGASASGFPAANSNCAWCARNVRAGSFPVGHQRNRPLDNRFVASQKPWPSYVSSLIAVPRRLRKMKKSPPYCTYLAVGALDMAASS